MPEETKKPVGKPDALFIPAGFATGDTTGDRVASICKYAESTLGADPLKSQKAYIRNQSGFYFVTLDPNDTIRFVKTSASQGSRYARFIQPDGVEFGYLVDAAKSKETPSA